MADGTPALGGGTWAGKSQRAGSNEACSSEPGTFGVGEEGLVKGFGKEINLKGLVWYPKGVIPHRVTGDTLFLGQSCTAAEIPRICAFRVSPNFLASSEDAQTSSNALEHVL